MVTTIQIILFTFSVIFFTVGVILAVLAKRGLQVTAGFALFCSLVLCVVSAVDPKSMEELIINKDSVHIRRDPTIEEQKVSIDIASEKPTLSAEKIDEAIQTAQKLTEQQRSDADYLVSADFLLYQPTRPIL